jgi:hypothetical protein
MPSGLANDSQDVLEEPIPHQQNEETNDSLHAGNVGAPAIFERTAPTNLMKMPNAGYKTTDARKTSGSQREMTMDVARMQQQPVYVGLEHTWDHTHQGPSTAGQNNPSAGNVGALAILGVTADMDTPETLPRRKLTKTGETNRRNREGDVSTTHVPSLHTQRDHHQARHYLWTAQERPVQTVRPTDGIRGDLPHLEGSLHKTDSRAVPTNNLSVHCQYHR